MNAVNSLFGSVSFGSDAKQELLIDIGSTNTRIIIGSKLVFFEPTCLAIHKHTGSVIAVGEKAHKLLGKTPKSVEISFPVSYGSVSNTKHFELFLSAILLELLPKNKFNRFIFGLRGKVSVPTSVSPAKKKLLSNCLKRVGFTKFEFIESSKAISKSVFNSKKVVEDICIIDIGGQSTEIAVLSMGEIISTKSFKWGGIQLSEALQRIVREKHHCVVGWHIAEAAKLQIGSVEKGKDKFAIRGKDLITQASKTILVSSNEVKEDFSKSLYELLDGVKNFLSLLPSETVISVLENGIFVTGGGSKLKGIDTLITQNLKCEVLLSRNPQKDTINGLSKL